MLLKEFTNSWGLKSKFKEEAFFLPKSLKLSQNI